MSGTARHIAVACLAVAFGFCAAQARAQSPATNVSSAETLTFSLTPEQLAFWSKGAWLIEAGRIDFWVGASSADLRASGSFEISKTHPGTAPAAALPTRVTVSNLN